MTDAGQSESRGTDSVASETPRADGAARDGSIDIDGVLIAGATGKTGSRLLGHLAGTDLTVRALTRSDEKEAMLHRRGADEVLVGDLLDPADADRAVEGVNAVCTCVGSTPLQVHLADRHVDGTGNCNLVDAAVDAGIETFVMQSSLGVDDDRGSWMARLFRRIVGPVTEGKTRTETRLRESPLRHTIFRPGVLLSYGPSVSHVADAGTGLWGVVTRGEVARLMAAALVTPAAAHRTLEVAYSPTQRGSGLDLDWTTP